MDSPINPQYLQVIQKEATISGIKWHWISCFRTDLPPPSKKSWIALVCAITSSRQSTCPMQSHIVMSRPKSLETCLYWVFGMESSRQKCYWGFSIEASPGSKNFLMGIPCLTRSCTNFFSSAFHPALRTGKKILDQTLHIYGLQLFHMLCRPISFGCLHVAFWDRLLLYRVIWSWPWHWEIQQVKEHCIFHSNPSSSSMTAFNVSSVIKPRFILNRKASW